MENISEEKRKKMIEKQTFFHNQLKESSSKGAQKLIISPSFGSEKHFTFNFELGSQQNGNWQSWNLENPKGYFLLFTMCSWNKLKSLQLSFHLLIQTKSFLITNKHKLYQNVAFPVCKNYRFSRVVSEMMEFNIFAKPNGTSLDMYR